MTTRNPQTIYAFRFESQPIRPKTFHRARNRNSIFELQLKPMTTQLDHQFHPSTDTFHTCTNNARIILHHPLVHQMKFEICSKISLVRAKVCEKSYKI